MDMMTSEKMLTRQALPNGLTLEFWDLSKNYGSDDEEEKYDPNNIKKRGQGPKINVKKSKW